MENRDALEAELTALGNRRRKALEDAATALEEALELAPRALNAGVSVRRVGELAAIGRPTLYSRLRLSERTRK